MPVEFGGSDEAVGPVTMRARGWPTLRQFCVFLENRVGRLNELLRQIEGSDLTIVALSVVDTIDFAVARVMVDDADRAREVLSLTQFHVIENDLLGVELPDDGYPFVSIFLALVSAEININYTYPLLFRHKGHPLIAIHVDNLDEAGRILVDTGHTLVTEDDLRDECGF